MAKKSGGLTDSGTNTGDTISIGGYNQTGNQPDVSESLKDKKRVVSDVNQAFSICETMVNDWKKGILNSARITAKINGELPYNKAKLRNAGKDWKSNISTGFLASECDKVLPRLYMPLKTAKYLTAASLPANYPEGQRKTEFFRYTITKAIKTWPKWNFYIRGLAREVGVFGFGFNAWFDKYDWRPSLLRMDKGFIPQGTEVMDNEPAFFMAKYDYKPSELLELLKNAKDADRDEWNTKNTVAAINGALPPPADATYPNARSYEDLIRQATWGYSYEKASKVIRTYHLFAKETDGKVSHYILLADPNLSKEQGRLLYEAEDKFDLMSEVQNTVVFSYGDGTVHGSWGAGAILYDIAAQVEKVRNDSIDNMRMTNKMKVQVPDAKNVNDVKLVVNDTMMIVSGAQFAGNTAAIPQDVAGYEALDNRLTQLAQQKIGAYVPPIPLQPSDIKAAQINAAMSKEQESQEALLENWLIQQNALIHNITKRLCMEGSPDEVSKGVRKTLLEYLTKEEIDMLVADMPAKSIMDFTDYAASKRGAFAASVMNNPLFNQGAAARFMAEGVGDETFVSQIVRPDGDQSEVLRATANQLVENAAISLGQAVPIQANDADFTHMTVMKDILGQWLQQGNTQLAQLGIQHYGAHYISGVSKKTLPKDQINPEKQFIAEYEKAVEQLVQRDQIQAQQQAAQQAAEQQAQQIVAAQMQQAAPQDMAMV